MKKPNLKVLIPAEKIEKRIKELALEIADCYRGEEITLIGIIKGALPFFMKLTSYLDLPQKWDFMALSSYGNTTKSSGVLKINMDLGNSIAGKHVLIVEDIIDTGLTMEYLLKSLKTRKPASIKICSLLFKKGNLRKKIKIDFTGFEIPTEFVVGFGLDCAERYRELPDICCIPNKEKK